MKLMGKRRQTFILNLFANGDYSCTSDGKVISHLQYHGGRVRKGRIQRNGYELIGIYSQKAKKYIWISTHQIVYLYFREGYSPNLQINHKDGNKLNNAIYNLELVTSSDNHKHAHRLGLETQKGSNNNASKLNTKEVKLIREYAKTGYKYTLIGFMFDVSSSNVSHIVNYRTWKET